MTKRLPNFKFRYLNPGTQDMKPSPPCKTPKLLTANQIANLIQRSTRGVMNTIERLNIHPQSGNGHFKLYAPEVTEKVRAAMRAPNKAEKPSTQTQTQTQA